MKNLVLDDLIRQVESYNPTEVEVIKKAYEYAECLHEGQYRQSGEPYISHPLNVAYILAEMHADRDTVCAGLLHDTLEDTNITKEDIAEIFNKDVANLVDGVTKLAKMNFSSKEEQNLANTRKIITGITEDVRIIIIKLADRLHNMRTLDFKSEFKQKENSIETLDIFVPLAYYIGAYRIKSELEDLSLRYLKPDKYRELSQRKKFVEESSKGCMEEMAMNIKRVLNDRGINSEIKVRTKNIYGIYKRFEQGHKLSDIHDLLSLKIMVDDIEDCYKVLYLIHREYHPINDKFKDYICNPKTNKYSSLHTTVFGVDNRLVQIQIRTFDMDRIASFGLATYWDINKGNARNVMQEELRGYQFFRILKEINEMSRDDREFVGEVKRELFSDKIYVYTPKGDIIELSKGSTPINFVYIVKPEIANIMTGVIVNDKIVDVDYVLQNKDRIRILVDELSFGPREDWLEMAHSSRVKKKIRDFGI